MNFFFKKTLLIYLFFIIYFFLKDILFDILIRFFEPKMSSFVILPSIVLVILLIIKIYKNKFDFIRLEVRKIDFIFYSRYCF